MTKEKFNKVKFVKRLRIREQERIIVFNKQYLADTDYQAIKFAEGVLSSDEYAPIKALREEARSKINEAELEIADLKADLKVFLETTEVDK